MTFRLIVLLFIIGHAGVAQNNFQEVVTSFNVYAENHYQEKVFIHTDRTFYLTGDYIMLKAYVVNGSNHQPTSVSKVMYFEILDAGNNPVLQSKVGVEYGAGYTALFLPPTLNSGYYTVRGYTRWMRNYAPELYFSKIISIVNPFKPLERNEPDAPAEFLDVQFFPEGGDLVNGIQSRVAFRIVDKNGNGQARPGAIINQEGDTITTFEPLKFGLGSFYITPLSNQTYHAVIRTVGGNLMEKSFPVVKPAGYVMNLVEQSDFIQISVKTNKIEKGQTNLLVHTRNNIIESKSQNLINGETQFKISKASFEAGISHITLFDNEMHPVCERLYFKQPTQGLQVSASFNENIYPKRQKVTVDLSSRSDGGINQAADLSIAVYRIDSLQAQDSITIENYLLLSSELAGNIESSAFYFSAHAMAAQVADNLMLTHGWRRFTWDNILERGEDLPYIPEFRGHIVFGTIKNRFTNELTPNITAYLTAPGKVFHLSGSASKSNGRLNFEVPNFYGENRIIVQPNLAKDSMYSVTIDNPFSEEYARSLLPHFYLDEELKSQLTRRSVNMQFENAYHESDRIKKKIPSSDTLNFFRRADDHYDLDDYTRFSIMEDVMRESINRVYVHKQNSTFSFSVVNGTSGQEENRDLRMTPIILLDGMPVFDANRIMEYDPLNIKFIDVVSQRYFYGALTFNGIVNFSTYKGDLKGFDIDSKALVKDYAGLEWQREYFSPRYEVNNDSFKRIPDSRDLLYWAPQVKTNKNGKAQISFYTSDQTGTYVVSIQGLTPEGLMGSASYRIIVSPE